MPKESLARLLILAVVIISIATACEAPSPTIIEVPQTELPATAVRPTRTPTATRMPPTATRTVAPSTSTPTSPASAASSLNSSQGLRFTHPTEITNPYYPVSLIGQSISQGMEGGQPYRIEVTLLPDTRTMTWNGQPIQVRVSQYVGYADGNLVEVSYDSFAQADDGGVYYFGEDVTAYKDGKVLNHAGSWQVGKDGASPSLIMPAHPQVGQVFNPENLPGVVFETDTIMSISEKTTTPGGAIDNGVLIKELLMDGSIEYKVNAANFGIVESRASDEKVNLVLFIRSDAKPGIVPQALTDLETQVEDIIDLAPGGDWKQISTNLGNIAKTWQAYRTQATTDKVPVLFQQAFTDALDDAQKNATAKDAAGTMRAANDLTNAVVDLFAVYHPALPPDLGRIDYLGRQIVLDMDENDFAGAADDLATINAIWVRLKPIVLSHKGSTVVTQFETGLAKQQSALDQKNASALKNETNKNLELVDTMESLF